jgi:hypothetical protein
VADNITASVKIQVRPDTTKFASELKAKVKAAVDKVQADLDKKPLKVRAQLDQKLAEDLKAAAEKAEKEVGELSIKVNLDNQKSLEAGIAKIRAELETLNSETINLDLDKGALEAKLAELEARHRTIVFEAKVKDNAFEALKRLTGFRLGQGMFSEFKDFLSNIDKKVPLIGSMTLAIGGLAGAAISAAGDIFSLSRALAQIGPGALALPGIFGGIGVGLIATTAVFKDFNKEFSSFAVGLGRKTKAGSAWQALQNMMSKQFWSKARAPMGDLIRTVFPQIQDGLLGTSRALAVFFGNLSKSLKRELGGHALTVMFEALNVSIRNFAKHTDAIARLVKIFGTLGTRQLPALANWAGKVADRFAAFMTNAQNTGKLDKWIATAVERLQALGRVLANVGKIFYGFAKAADNATAGNALDNLANGLGRVAKWVNSDAIQKRLTAVFAAAHTMMSRIAERSGPAFSRYMSAMSQNLLRLLPRLGDAIGTLFGSLFDYLGNPAVQNGMFNLVDGVAKGLDSLRPVMGDLASKMGELFTVVGDLAKLFGTVFAAKIKALTPLMTLVLTVLDGLVKVLNLLPSQLFEIVAALVLWNKINTALAAGSLVSIGRSLLRLIPGYGLFSRAVTTSTVALEANTVAAGENAAVNTAAATKMSGLKSMMGSLAGAGGLLLLADGFSRGSSSAKGFGTALEKSVGGALLGLRAGPIGAAIGFTAGLAASFKDLQAGWSHLLHVDPDGTFGKLTRDAADAAKKAATAMGLYRNSLKDLQSTLDQMTGASTADTRVKALGIFSDQYKDLYKHLRSIGVTDREISMAVTGNKQATQAIMQALAGKEGLVGVDPTTQFHQYADALGDISLRTQAAANKTRQAATVTQDLSSLYKHFPRKVATAINIQGVVPTMKGVRQVAQQYGIIDKRKLTALIRASGWKPTKAQVDSLIASLNGVSKAKPNLKGFQAAVTKGVSGAKPKAKVSAQDLANAMGLPLQNMKPDLKQFTQGISKKLTGQQAPAKGDAKGIANFIIAGLQGGLRSGDGSLSATAAAIVRNAIASMRRAAKIHSPSRETMAIGDYMGQGLVIGLGKHRKDLLATARSLVKMLLKGLSGAEGPEFQKRVNTLTSLLPNVTKGMSKTQIAAVKKKRASLLKALAPEQKEMNKLYGQWSSIVGKIKGTIKSIFDQAAQLKATLVDSISALGDPTQLGLADGQVPTFQAITQNLADAIAKAKAFAAALALLKKEGLNNTTLAQLVNAGPDAALGVAQAIANAGKDGVKALNQQQATLEQYANQAGNTVQDLFITNGMHIADGLLKGLRDKRKDIEAEMTKLANSMVKTIKTQLGIHSPSRVFKKIGAHVSEGMALGIKSVDVEPPQVAGQINLSRASRSISDGGVNSSADGGTHIENLTIELSLDDLEKLKTLDDFFALLKTKARQGVKRP